MAELKLVGEPLTESKARKLRDTAVKSVKPIDIQSVTKHDLVSSIVHYDRAESTDVYYILEQSAPYSLSLIHI